MFQLEEKRLISSYTKKDGKMPKKTVIINLETMTKKMLPIFLLWVWHLDLKWRGVEMGFFNIIKIKDKCPCCRKNTCLTIQFKYGENWMHSYNIGDSIIWGQNNIGKKVSECILVSAISEECPICNECSDYVVEINNNIIVRVYADEIHLSFEKEGYRILGL